MSDHICVSNQDNGRIVVGVERNSFDMLLMAGAIVTGWEECEVSKKGKPGTESGAKADDAPPAVEPARKPRKAKSAPTPEKPKRTVRPCPVPRCRQPSKGPRYSWFCAVHRDMPKREREKAMKAAQG